MDCDSERIWKLVETHRLNVPKRRRPPGSSLSLFDRLHDCYVECTQKANDKNFDKRFRNTVNLLQQLSPDHAHPSLVVNLYSDERGYSLVLNPDGNGEEIFLPYEDNEIFGYLDNQEIPPVLMEVLSRTKHCHMYSGCVVCEVRDYRHPSSPSSPSPSSPSSPSSSPHHYDSHLLMLRPTTESILQMVNEIASENSCSPEDQLLLESKLLLATQPPICLDPSTEVVWVTNRLHYNRRKFHSPAMRRYLRRHSQARRARMSHTVLRPAPMELRLHDFLTASDSPLKCPRSEFSDAWKRKKLDLTLPSTSTDMIAQSVFDLATVLQETPPPLPETTPTADPQVVQTPLTPSLHINNLGQRLAEEFLEPESKRLPQPPAPIPPSPSSLQGLGGSRTPPGTPSFSFPTQLSLPARVATPTVIQAPLQPSHPPPSTLPLPLIAHSQSQQTYLNSQAPVTTTSLPTTLQTSHQQPVPRSLPSLHPQPTLLHQQPRPTLSHQQPRPTLSHQQQQPTLSHQQPRPTLSHQQPQPTLSHQQQQPTLSHQQPQPTLSHQQPQPTLSHQQQQPTLSHQQPQPTLSHQQPQPHQQQQPTLSHQQPRPTLSHQQQQPTLSHQQPQPTLSHQQQQPTLSHQQPRPTLSHQQQQPTLSHQQPQPTLSHQQQQPTLSHQQQQPTLSHQQPRPTLSHQQQQPTLSHQQPTRTLVPHILPSSHSQPTLTLPPSIPTSLFETIRTIRSGVKRPRHIAPAGPVPHPTATHMVVMPTANTGTPQHPTRSTPGVIAVGNQQPMTTTSQMVARRPSGMPTLPKLQRPPHLPPLTAPTQPAAHMTSMPKLHRFTTHPSQPPPALPPLPIPTGTNSTRSTPPLMPTLRRLATGNGTAPQPSHPTVYTATVTRTTPPTLKASPFVVKLKHKTTKK